MNAEVSILTGMLPASRALQGGVLGSYIKSTKILTRARSTAVRQNPRLLGRGASIRLNWQPLNNLLENGFRVFLKPGDCLLKTY